MNTKPLLAIAATTAALVLTGCGSTGSAASTSTESTRSTTTQAAANDSPSSASTSSSCQSQALVWRNGGGASHISAIVSDLSAIQKALVANQDAGSDSFSAESALQSAATALKSDVRTAEAALPPACIPGFRLPYRQALTEYSNAAGDFQDMVSELRRSNESVAMADAQAGTNAIAAGDTQFDAADAALSAFVNS